jgi:hypothetical protein
MRHQEWFSHLIFWRSEDNKRKKVLLKIHLLLLEVKSRGGVRRKERQMRDPSNSERVL